MRAKREKPLNKKRIIFLALMALLLISGALLFNTPKQSEIIEVRFPSGAKLQAEVADTPEGRYFGLAFRESLPKDGGMIFLFEESGLHKVLTGGFQFPIDLIWVDESKQIVHIEEGVQPCMEDPCPWHGPPPENARYVIETNVGFVQRAEAVVGTDLIFALRM
ncbi:MAG: DUF192 domain-containing protein [Nitrospirae bacterium]|nr:DUF192 domain-containing protein [Nitrospirota bacterium]MDA1304062.1 DUF192 domain-containing protein [Nitrospirota bacterium]